MLQTAVADEQKLWKQFTRPEISEGMQTLLLKVTKPNGHALITQALFTALLPEWPIWEAGQL